jgi:hypothetical protein
MNYIKPKINEKSFTCPHCHTLSFMEYQRLYFPQDNTVNGSKICLHVARCLNCGKKIIWNNDIYIYPEIQPQEANPDMPETVLQLYNEAGSIYNKSSRAACALLRLAIDRLCNELGEKDRDINKNIGALVKRGLSADIQKALDIVRVVGNKAVHPGQIEFDVDNVDTATMLFQLINIIVDRMISEPKKIDGLFDKLPESAKQSIEQRDK